MFQHMTKDYVFILSFGFVILKERHNSLNTIMPLQQFIALTITAGLLCDRIKIKGVKLGVTWILFLGIILGQLGFTLDPTTAHFVKEFGLILFVYSIGLEVGPHFFSSFKKGGVTLNLLATGIVLLGTVTAYLIHVITGEDLNAMTGVLYGSVTNTPGLGAAQQTFSDLNDGANNSLFACGYAVAYPMGVLGIMMSIIFLRVIFRIDLKKEQRQTVQINKDAKAAKALKIVAPDVEQRMIKDRSWKRFMR